MSRLRHRSRKTQTRKDASKADGLKHGGAPLSHLHGEGMANAMRPDRQSRRKRGGKVLRRAEGGKTDDLAALGAKLQRLNDLKGAIASGAVSTTSSTLPSTQPSSEGFIQHLLANHPVLKSLIDEAEGAGSNILKGASTVAGYPAKVLHDFAASHPDLMEDLPAAGRGALEGASGALPYSVVAGLLSDPLIGAGIMGVGTAVGATAGLAKRHKQLLDALSDMSPAASGQPVAIPSSGDDALSHMSPAPDPERASGGKLTAAHRNKLPSSDFAGPDRSYPIPDASHARNALARASQHASPELQAKIKAKVRRRYPGIAVGGEEE